MFAKKGIGLKNQISDITPLKKIPDIRSPKKKIKYQISRYHRPSPPPPPPTIILCLPSSSEISRKARLCAKLPMSIRPYCVDSPT